VIATTLIRGGAGGHSETGSRHEPVSMLPTAQIRLGFHPFPARASTQGEYADSCKRGQAWRLPSGSRKATQATSPGDLQAKFFRCERIGKRRVEALAETPH